jgi:hypothetical protein
MLEPPHRSNIIWEGQDERFVRTCRIILSIIQQQQQQQQSLTLIWEGPDECFVRRIISSIQQQTATITDRLKHQNIPQPI